MQISFRKWLPSYLFFRSEKCLSFSSSFFSFYTQKGALTTQPAFPDKVSRLSFDLQPNQCPNKLVRFSGVHASNLSLPKASGLDNNMGFKDVLRAQSDKEGNGV